MGSGLATLKCIPRYDSSDELDELREELMARQHFYDDLLQNPPEGTAEMLALISTLQSDRINDQRAELHPVNPQATLPGVRAIHTTRPNPEEDFVEVLARVQGTRLEDQRTTFPKPKNDEEKEAESQNEFLTRLMKAQAGRMEDQRATIPLKEKAQPSNSKK